MSRVSRSIRKVVLVRKMNPDQPTQPSTTNKDDSEVPKPAASVATYEGRDRGVNPISVVTECDWHSKGCGRPVASDSHADPEG